MSGCCNEETKFLPRRHLPCGNSQAGQMRHPTIKADLISSGFHRSVGDKSPDGANNNRTGLDSGFASAETTSTDVFWANVSIANETPPTESALASLLRQMSQAGVNLHGSMESVEMQPPASVAEDGDDHNFSHSAKTDCGFSDEDDQESHTSSLESVGVTDLASKQSMTDWENEVDPNRLNAVEGDTEQDDISLGCTTSCSSDSFEVSSSAPASSISNDKMLTISNNHQGGLIEKTFEKSREEIRPTTRQNPFLSEDTVSLIDLDTRMPTFDFERLEKQLKTAIEEQENKDKLLMSDQVRKEMRIFGDETRPYPAPPATRPQRSNLGSRLKIGRDLQICFMNDTEENEKEGGRCVSKSKSTPMLGEDSMREELSKQPTVLTARPETSAKSYNSSRNTTPLGRSVSSCSDSSLRASDLRLAAQRLEDAEMTENPIARQQRLEREARVMLSKAKLAAHMQMEVERQSFCSNDISKRHSYVDELVGFPVSKKRVTRPQLTKMNITQLQLVVNEAHGKIKALNEELVQLLIERDSLHMEQDSMLVDIEDLLQHQKCTTVKLPEFLVLTSPSPEASSKPRIFKK